jgi:hypothetical protein
VKSAAPTQPRQTALNGASIRVHRYSDSDSDDTTTTTTTDADGPHTRKRPTKVLHFPVLSRSKRRQLEAERMSKLDPLFETDL